MKHRDKSDAFAEQTSALEHGNNPGRERQAGRMDAQVEEMGEARAPNGAG